MIKKSFRLMLLVAFALSSVMFVACNKYDDDIERIDNELAALNATVSSLKAAVDGGAVISSVSNTTDGVKFTLSNGQSYTVNHGAVGANGADGKNGSVVTIGENGNWFIDGVDTGKSAKGQDGKAPQINAAGNWEVWDAATQSWVDTKQSAVGAQTYVIEYSAYYELHVMEQDAEGNNLGFKVVLLPKTLPISNIKVVTLNDNVITREGAEIVLNYGSALSRAKSFNGKDYAKGSYLTAAGASLSAMINPTSVDASVLQFSLVDSKGNAPYVISKVAANMTESALTKADKTANAGVWDMAVELHPDLTYQDLAGNTFADARSQASYALAVNTANGIVASAYDVKVTENNVTSLTVGTLADLTGKVNEGLDLRKAFVETTGSTVADLTPYIVDCYFAIADATKAAAYGVTLNGDVLTATKPVPASENFLIKASYLLVDGTEMDMAEYPYTYYKTFKVTFNQVASTMSLGDVNWTIKTRTGSSTGFNKVYLPITAELKSILTGTADAQVPTIATVKFDNTTKTAWTWADGSELDSKAVAVNGVQYGYGTNAVKFATANLDEWIAKVDETGLYQYSSSSGYYIPSTPNINSDQYVRFDFNTAQAFPGEYKLTLVFTSTHPTNPVTVKVPVKVVITAPAATSSRLVRNSAYFSGDDAVVYGNPSGAKVAFNLFDLYKSMNNGYNDEAANVSFTTTHEIHSCSTEWLTTTDANGVSTDGNISVGKSRYNYSSDNRDGVYTTRQVQVYYKQFGNPHIPYIVDEFNLTVKSELAEGTFDASAASINITNTQTHMISFKNIVAKDVYGDVYELGTRYSAVKDANGNVTGWTATTTGKDSRINGDVTIVLYDDNASQYLEVVSGTVNANDGYSALQIKRKANASGGYAALTSDVTCVVKVRFTDMWGRRVESAVNVTIKKN